MQYYRILEFYTDDIKKYFLAERNFEWGNKNKFKIRDLR